MRSLIAKATRAIFGTRSLAIVTPEMSMASRQSISVSRDDGVQRLQVTDVPISRNRYSKVLDCVRASRIGANHYPVSQMMNRFGPAVALTITSILFGTTANAQCVPSGSVSGATRIGPNGCYLVWVTECAGTGCCAGVSGYPTCNIPVWDLPPRFVAANCNVMSTAVPCGLGRINITVACNAVPLSFFVPPCGPDPYALTRGRIRGNGTPPRVPYTCTSFWCRPVVIGVRGFLPGTVRLARIARSNEFYRWRRAETDALVSNGIQSSGSFVSGATSAEMTITSIDTPDEGLYILEAAACEGCFYSQVDAVRVYVDRPVTSIVSTPQNREACLGGSTEFLVIAEEPSGVPATYRWYRNGVLITDGVQGGIGTVSGATTPLLTISNLAAGAAGNYACHIITDSYVNNTFDAALTISSNTTAPVVLAPPQSVTVAAEASAYMIADIDVQAGQVPSFQWRKDGVPIYDDGRIEGAQTEQLVFNRVIAGDIGQYDCVVTRGCASTTTAAAGLSLCIADYNNDGGIDGGDVESFFVDWEAGNPGSDVNTDGGIDGTDVEVFFSRWEAGC